MWLLLAFSALWLGILIYEFSTGQLLSWGTPRLFGKEIEPDSEAFWAVYAFRVFGFLFFVGYLVWIFYFKGH